MKGWKTVRLSEFCLTGTGGTPSRSKLERYYEGGTIPWVKSGELRESVINKTEERITEAALKETNIKLVPPGALLLAMYGATVGRLGILGIAATTNQAVCHIIPDPTAANVRFLFHALSNQVSNLIARGVGGAQPNISQGIIKDLALALPPLAEQRRIAEVLDRAETLRAKRRAALAQLDSLTQSLFLDLFGDPKSNPKRWPMRSFDETMRDETARSEKLQQAAYLPAGRHPVVDQGQSEIAGYCNDDALLCASSLPVVVFGDHTRAVKLVSLPFVVGADGAKVLVPQAGIDAVFLATLLRLSPIPDLGYSRHMREVKRLLYIAPPIALQCEFAHQVAALEALKATHRASLTELDALFASLQHRAFKGEL